MNKININQLKYYLGTELKCKTSIGVLEMTNLNTVNKRYPVWFKYNGKHDSKEFNKPVLDKHGIIGKGISLKNTKPIVYPLSSLTEEITHPVTGEKFVPIESLEKEFSFTFLDTHVLHIDQWEFSVIKKLIEWHFWIFDQSVFNQGLAIDKSKI